MATVEMQNEAPQTEERNQAQELPMLGDRIQYWFDMTIAILCIVALLYLLPGLMFSTRIYP